ncbi:MFS transporter [Methanococcoides methylutens]|uniref:Tetracycline resistance protein n=1 Tax=Methanococcoides methylutens MM1 TaxID=1434104 RepID=A0A0E3SS70_METMT|nr:MFS transporter [Methanococcoides methylutens]AKB85172.1 Tetracycline resistance protein [Methanococcoides methylutens MM1]
MEQNGCEPKKVRLFPLLLINFINTLGFGLVLPFLVFLVDRFGGNAIVYGFIGAMYPAFQLIGGPILGRWSDLHGRKKILFITQAGTLLSWIIFLLAFFTPVETLLEVNSAIFGAFIITIPLLILFIARSFDGLTGGNIAVANAYLADITEEKDRNRNFGKMSISTNLGFIIGPALAGLLSITMYGELIPVLAAALISLAGTIVIAIYLPESRQCTIKKPGKMGFREVIRIKNIPYMLLIYFLIFLGFNIFYTAFPLHAIKALQWSVADMGIYFSVLGIIMIAVQGPVLSQAVKRYSDAQLAIFGSIVLGTNFILLVTGNIALTYLAAFFFALGNGLMWPSILSIISKLAGKEHQGAVQGFASSFSSLASIVGLILGGFLYEILGGISFIIAAAIVYTVFLLSFRMLSFEREVQEEV